MLDVYFLKKGALNRNNSVKKLQNILIKSFLDIKHNIKAYLEHNGHLVFLLASIYNIKYQFTNFRKI
jgi:hypothetical protein